MKKQGLFIAGGIIASILMVASAVILAQRRTSYYSSAATGNTSKNYSRQNSYMFASPIQASADGVSSIRITVFLLDSQGLGVEGEVVDVQPQKGVLTTAKIAPITDTFGRAYFDVTSTNAGSYTILAEAGGVTLPQKVGISFR